LDTILNEAQGDRQQGDEHEHDTVVCAGNIAGSGLLLHVTSLPSRTELATWDLVRSLGSHRAPDAGPSWWQALPLGQRDMRTLLPGALILRGKLAADQPDALIEDGLFAGEAMVKAAHSGDSSITNAVTKFKRVLIDTPGTSSATPGFAPAIEQFCNSQTHC